ncbi:MAG: hypothetical protein M3138_07145 [Actinomycetota bacterium]|nr:hypothetical protein [Actinomycetota bacterium]
MSLRSPNEIPGRPTSVLVPTYSDNENPGTKAQRRRLAVEWRRRNPSWWQRLLRLKLPPPAD